MKFPTDEIQTLIFEYLEGPKILEESLLGMSKEDMLKRPIEGKWSTLEVICHIADMEIVYADRIKRILAEEPLCLAQILAILQNLCIITTESQQKNYI
jgi:hypothetical protein